MDILIYCLIGISICLSVATLIVTIINIKKGD